MPAAQTETATEPMTVAAYTDALAAACTDAGLRCRAWHGATAHRIYRGEDYVEVYEAADGTGGFSGIRGLDRGFGAALRTANRVLGDVPIAAEIAVTAPAIVRPAHRHGGRRTGCPCGSLCETPRSTDCSRCKLDY